jgi:hypothetical protein
VPQTAGIRRIQVAVPGGLLVRVFAIAQVHDLAERRMAWRGKGHVPCGVKAESQELMAASYWAMRLKAAPPVQNEMPAEFTAIALEFGQHRRVLILRGYYAH